MDPIDLYYQYREISRKHFNEFASKYDVSSVNRVGWTSRTTQENRFEAIQDIGEIENRSILDVGCGVGDFYEFLVRRHKTVIYKGIELIRENFIAAEYKYGKGLFYNQDIVELPESEKYDYVIASGIFALPFHSWEVVTSFVIGEMFKRCNIGIAANFLSGYVKAENSFSYHVLPSKIVEICSDFSKIFRLRHDYSKKGNDFTIYLYKEFQS